MPLRQNQFYSIGPRRTEVEEEYLTLKYLFNVNVKFASLYFDREKKKKWRWRDNIFDFCVPVTTSSMMEKDQKPIAKFGQDFVKKIDSKYLSITRLFVCSLDANPDQWSTRATTELCSWVYPRSSLVEWNEQPAQWWNKATFMLRRFFSDL